MYPVRGVENMYPFVDLFCDECKYVDYIISSQSLIKTNANMYVEKLFRVWYTKPNTSPK